MSAEKFAYENIEIPDDRLIQAIYDGMGKGVRIRRRRYLVRSLGAAAAAFILLLCSANIPAVYAYACEVPILGEFVRALHIGRGGEKTLHEAIETEVSQNELVIYFINEGRTTETVVPYEVQHYLAPSRIELALNSLTEEEYQNLEEQIRRMKGVGDVYRTISLEENEISFVLVLERLYDYEVMEQAFPGMLSIRLYQDAYFTAEEKAPEQRVYYLRTKGMEQGEELKKLLKRYENESPTQVKTQEGSFILTIGEFSSEKEAENRMKELQEEYAGATEFMVSYGMVKEIPER